VKYKLWDGLRQWIDLSKGWVDTKFKEIKVDDIQVQVDKFDKQSSICYIMMKENPMT
jgi:hypothetical protein